MVAVVSIPTVHLSRLENAFDCENIMRTKVGDCQATAVSGFPWLVPVTPHRRRGQDGGWRRFQRRSGVSLIGQLNCLIPDNSSLFRLENSLFSSLRNWPQTPAESLAFWGRERDRQGQNREIPCLFPC